MEVKGLGEELTVDEDLDGEEENLEAKVKRDASLDVSLDVCDDGNASLDGLKILLAFLVMAMWAEYKELTRMMSAQIWAQALMVTRSLRLTMMPTLTMAAMAALTQMMMSPMRTDTSALTSSLIAAWTAMIEEKLAQVISCHE